MTEETLDTVISKVLVSGELGLRGRLYFAIKAYLATRFQAAMLDPAITLRPQEVKRLERLFESIVSVSNPVS